MQPSTTEQIHATSNQPPAISSKPEWLRVPETTRIFGISRSSLYELIAAGAIKSTCLKKRGAVRGIRLISFDSIAAYIEAAAANRATSETELD